MFTGLVEEMGQVKAARPGSLTISAREALEGTKIGDSINVNGACLTVVRLEEGAFTVEVMEETRRRTNLGELRVGDRVNLERAAALGGRLGGHLVQGHVDATASVLSQRWDPDKSGLLVWFQPPQELMRYIVEKGFVAVDGVSLTVVERQPISFSVSLVAYTREHTTLGQRKAGDRVNLEVDIIGKYVESLLERKGSPITLDFLAQHGFL